MAGSCELCRELLPEWEQNEEKYHRSDTTPALMVHLKGPEQREVTFPSHSPCCSGSPLLSAAWSEPSTGLCSGQLWVVVGAWLDPVLVR